MISICMCDDNLVLLKEYQGLLEDTAKKHGISVSIKLFQSGDMLIKHFQNTLDKIDIIYSDILMEGLNGIETAKVLRRSGCSAEIVFLTSSQDHVFEAFSVNPLYYMSKFDIDNDKFAEVFLKAVSFTVAKNNNIYTVASPNDKTKIPLENILYFKKDGNALSIQCQHTNFDSMDSLEYVMAKFADKNFISSHPDFFVNLRKVKKVGPDSITMLNGDVIPLAKDLVNAFKSALSNCLGNSF